VLGVDPIADYTPVLEQAGLTINVYEETPGWANGVYPTFSELIGASGTLSEAMLTVAVRPYPRLVHIVARRPG
jgi:hypothetical protein